MRPVMFKFNSDRKDGYRIKTVIYQDSDKKYVVKEALTKEAGTHIKQIYENYTALKSIYPAFYICPAELRGDSLFFEFIEGITFSKKYENAIAHASKEEFIAALIEQKRLILSCKDDNFCQFKPEKDFVHIFGEGAPYVNQKAMKCSDFEFTSHNIINKKDGQVVLIDYEYVFCFPVPVSLLLYHCIIKTNMFTIEGFDRMLDMAELLNVLEIENTVDELETSWLHFQNHNSIGLIERAKDQYLKSSNNVNELLEKYYQDEQDIKGHLNYIHILTQNLEEQQQYIQILSNQINHNKTEIEELSNELVEKEKKYISEKEQYESTIRHQLAKNKILDDEIKKCYCEIQSVSDHLCQKDAVISEQAVQIDILQNTNLNLAKSKELLESEVNMIKHSVSWRITEPIRRVFDLFRR